MTREQLTTAAVGAALTLVGAIILSALQALQRSAEDHRLNQREWHKDLVDLIADFEYVMIHLTAAVNAQSGFSAEQFKKAFDEIFSSRGLLWRMTRLERGHPDPRVRVSVGSLVYAIVRIVGFMQESGQLDPERGKAALSEREAGLKKVIVEIKKVLDQLMEIIHGGRRRHRSWPTRLIGGLSKREQR
ncbi:hypothetical protein [Micromonospora sp. NPDC092111]|uniref:hypothetical protein n=1 Tax=Micromonospora sp. NPDC092111 TaxID=3364289 RepID=UPI00382BE013